MVKTIPTQQQASDDGRPTVSDLQGGDPLAQAAKKHWLNDKSPKFKPNAVKTDFYDTLEKDGFRYKSLLLLEQLQFLEKSVLRESSANGGNGKLTARGVGICGRTLARMLRISTSYVLR